MAAKYVIHDPARYLSHEESFTADDYLSGVKALDISKKVRHIYSSANNLPVVCNDKYVRKKTYGALWSLVAVIVRW